MNIKEFAKQVAIVHQHNTAPADLSVEKLVSYGRTPYRSIGSPEIQKKMRRKINWAMEITHTDKYRDKPVAELSGGQKQRVWIACHWLRTRKYCSLTNRPHIWIYDTSCRYSGLIRKLNREYGITIIMVLHDINQSLYYSDNIIAMRDGKIVGQGEPEDILMGNLVNAVYDVELDVCRIDGKPFVMSV